MTNSCIYQSLPISSADNKYDFHVWFQANTFNKICLFPLFYIQNENHKSSLSQAADSVISLVSMQDIIRIRLDKISLNSH